MKRKRPGVDAFFFGQGLQRRFAHKAAAGGQYGRKSEAEKKRQPSCGTTFLHKLLILNHHEIVLRTKNSNPGCHNFCPYTPIFAAPNLFSQILSAPADCPMG